MSIAVRIGLVVGVMCLGSQAIAEDKQFTSPAGYSFTYPADWTLTTESSLEQSPERVRKWARDNNIKFDNDAVFLLAPPKAGNFHVIRIVLLDIKIPISEYAARVMADEIPTKIRSEGGEAGTVTPSIDNVGGKPVLIFDFDAKYPTSKEILHQCIYYLRSADQTLVVACGTARSDFLNAKPVFQKIVASFQVRPTNHWSEWWDGQPQFVRTAIKFAVVGGGIAIVLFFWLRKL